jgi:PAS domain S-box-containing protein
MTPASEPIAVTRRDAFRESSALAPSAEGLFRAVADGAPVMLWLTGPDEKVTFFNRSWLAFTGRALAQELGCGWLDGVHPDDRESNVALCVRAMRARQPFTIECRLRRFDGEYRWMFGHGCPRTDASGAFLGYVGSCADVTGRKTALTETQQRLTDSEERMRQLAARIETARR